MSILDTATQATAKNPRAAYSADGRRNSDSIFSMADAREIIRTRNENAAADSVEQIIEKKKDMLAHQSTASVPQKVGMASVEDIFGFNPIQSKQTNVCDRDPEDISQKYRKYYRLLLKLKDDVKRGLSKLTNDNLAISVGQPKDGTDQEIESFDSEFAISLMSNEQEALTEIEEAIQRIYNGTYGICELTGKPIEPKRLLAVPFARYSMEGQMEKEKARQVSVARGSIFQADQSDDELSGFEDENDE
jgi:RNA polymerase-binding transcription factor DksA